MRDTWRVGCIAVSRRWGPVGAQSRQLPRNEPCLDPLSGLQVQATGRLAPI